MRSVSTLQLAQESMRGIEDYLLEQAQGLAQLINMHPCPLAEDVPAAAVLQRAQSQGDARSADGGTGSWSPKDIASRLRRKELDYSAHPCAHRRSARSCLMGTRHVPPSLSSAPRIART